MALPVLRAALDGYNGTVFAFGQTGSGKTFTITGGTERYADRGLIPRAISALFAEAAARSGHTYAVHISYLEVGKAWMSASAMGSCKSGCCCGHKSSVCQPLTGADSCPWCPTTPPPFEQIYNESGFDLLEPGREVRALEDLPRVRTASDSGLD